MTVYTTKASQATQVALCGSGYSQSTISNPRSSAAIEVSTASNAHCDQSIMASAQSFAKTWMSFLVSVLFLCLIAVPAPSLAQTAGKLVANKVTNDYRVLNNRIDAAQGFSTATSTRKWRITSVEWDIQAFDAGANAKQPVRSVEIWTAGQFEPHTKLHTFQGNVNDTPENYLQDGFNEFAANGEFYLESGSYYLVFDIVNIPHPARKTFRMIDTSDKGEDTDIASGWSIWDQSLWRNPTYGPNWPSSSQFPFKIAINGYQVNAQAPVVSITPQFTNDTAIQPVNTDLVLTAQGSDPDGGAAVTFSWEAFDIGGELLVDVTDQVLSINGDTATFNSDEWGNFTVRVTATDDEGATRQAQVAVTATTPESTDSSLSALELTDADGDALTLNPAFDPAVASYTVTLDHPTSGDLDVTATFNQSIARFIDFGLYRRGDLVQSVIDPTSGTAEQFTSVLRGDNTVRIEVSSADTTTSTTYNVVVTRSAFDPIVDITVASDFVDINTDLALTGSGYDPDGGDVLLTWSATDSDGNAASVLTVNASDSTMATFNASTWDHYTISLTVTDDEMNAETELVEITARSTASKDATLSALVVADSEGTALTLTPTFASGTTAYTAALTEIEADPSGLDLLVTATLNQSEAFLGMLMDRSDGTNDVPESPTSGTEERIVALTPGENAMSVDVQSPDGLTNNQYVVTVTANPLPIVIVTPDDPTVGTGLDLVLSGTATDMIPAGGDLTFEWFAVDIDAEFVTDDVLTVGTDTSMATFRKTLTDSAVSETYWVTMTATDENGGVGRDTVQITVSPNLPPVVTVNPSGPVTVDAGKDLALTGSATDPDDDPLVTYAWTAVDSNHNDATAALSGADTLNATFNATTLGTYIVTLTVTDDGGAPGKQAVTVNVVSPLVFSTTSLMVPEDGGTGDWMVKLREAPMSTVTVSIESGDANTATVSPSSLIFTPSDWNVDQAVTARGVNDNVPNTPARSSIITHTVSGADYTGATDPSSIVSVTTVDDDIPGFKVSQTTLSVDEDGGTGTWTVRLNTQPSANVTVTLSNSNSGTATIMPASTLTFTAENWNDDQIVTATAVDNKTDDNTARTTTVTHTVSSTDMGYSNITAQTVMVTLIDDDERGVTITPTALTILEDSEGIYTIKLNSQPTGTNSTVLVSATVTKTSGMRELNYENAAATAFTITRDMSNWENGVDVTFEVPNDDTPAEDTVYTVTHMVSGADYASGVAAETVTVTIPGFSALDSGNSVAMMVESDGTVTVPMEHDFPEGVAGVQLQFDSGTAPMSAVKIGLGQLPEGNDGPRGFSTEDGVPVNIQLADMTSFDGRVTICLPRVGGGRVYRWDDEEEPGGWVALEFPDDDFNTPGPDYACGVTEDGFSLFAAGSAQGSVAQARLAQLGRVMAGQVVDAVQNRLSASREAGFKATMAGQALPSFGENLNLPAYASTPRHDSGTGITGARDWENTQIQSLTEQSLLSGSSFSLTDRFADLSSVSVWGQASLTGFDGEGLEDGQMTSGFFGADWASDDLTAGLALSLNRGKGTWVSDRDGEDFKSSLTGIHPYFGYELSNRMSVWGVAGYGQGDIETTDGGKTTSVDMDMLMLAGGTSGDLESPAFMSEDVSLSLNSDLQWVRMGTDTEDASASRLRVAVKAAWQTSTDDGGQLKPSAEVGLRLDGGDAETGFGIDFGGGLGWSDASRGMSAELRGRALMTHESNDLRERSISGSFGWDANSASAEGSSLTVSYIVGSSVTGGTEALFSRNSLDSIKTIGDDLGNHRMEVRLGYGIPVLGGRFIGTPQTAFGYSDDERDVSLGLRMTLIDRSAVRGTGSLDLSVEARRSESAGDSYRSEDEFVLRLSTQF